MNRKSFKPAIQSKIKHIFDTSTRGSATTFNLGGCGHDVRVRLEYQYFASFFHKWFTAENIEQSIREIEKLFPNGIVIIMRNEDYFTMKESIDPLEQCIVSRLGSDETLSSVIHIESRDSNCNEALVKMIDKLHSDTTLKPLQKKSVRMSHKGCNSNSHWEGHYAIVAKGGNNKLNVNEGNIPLGNPIYDYADDYTSESIEYHMIYMMLCSENAKILLNDESKFEQVKEMYRVECEKRGLLDFEKFAPSTPIDEDGNLRCCVLNNPIKAEHFFLPSTHDDAVEYCHIESKNESYIEIVDGRIQTIFRPYNIAWGHRWANRGQNEMSIVEFRSKIKSSAAQLP